MARFLIPLPTSGFMGPVQNTGGFHGADIGCG
jgi:hypothetical protein